MSFEVDKQLSAWAHIALCADLTWTTEPPDEFVMANQRLWAQHCRLSQIFQDAASESYNFKIKNQNESDKRQNSKENNENGSYSGRKSVKEVIPESRLAQFYGNFYYDEIREKCYTNTKDKANGRHNYGQGCDNCDLTECWMLPEVEYWFRKLLDESSDRNSNPRRRRQYKILTDDDFEDNRLQSAASERWNPTAVRTSEESALAARVLSVRPLWTSSVTSSQRPLSPLPTPRKIRARRRQPRRFATLAPPPPSLCVDAPSHLPCDPARKFHFESAQQPQVVACQRALNRLTASVQAVMRASAVRCPLYRGTNISRYAIANQRSIRYADRRYGVWWTRDHPSPRLGHRIQITSCYQTANDIRKPVVPNGQEEEKKIENISETRDNPRECKQISDELQQAELTKQEKLIVDQTPSTSEALDNGLNKKRLYSTVLSTSAPPQINLAAVGCVRLSQKLTPEILKLNPKIVMPAARIRPQVVDTKFEELEKEALEQYKTSDESIDTKFNELEKQAEEQYTTSNSNTSCCSGTSAEKKASYPLVSESDSKESAKFNKDKAVNSVVIYSHNFPDMSEELKCEELKNFHIPPRGEKKKQTGIVKDTKASNLTESHRAASDTDNEPRNGKGSRKGSMKWTLRMVPPKKRHITLYASDLSSDDDMEHASGSIGDARPYIKSQVSGKVKLSAHGGGDLHPTMRKM